MPGGMGTKIPDVTPDGFEMTYQVNYLAPFLLTTQLMDLLVESRASSVTTTSIFTTCGDPGALSLTSRHGQVAAPAAAYSSGELANGCCTPPMHRQNARTVPAFPTVHPGCVPPHLGPEHPSQARVQTSDTRRQSSAATPTPG